MSELHLLCGQDNLAAFDIQGSGSTLVGVSLSGGTFDTSIDPFVFEFDDEPYSSCTICVENVVISKEDATAFTNAEEKVCTTIESPDTVRSIHATSEVLSPPPNLLS